MRGAVLPDMQGLLHLRTQGGADGVGEGGLFPLQWRTARRWGAEGLPAFEAQHAPGCKTGVEVGEQLSLFSLSATAYHLGLIFNMLCANGDGRTIYHSMACESKQLRNHQMSSG